MTKMKTLVMGIVVALIFNGIFLLGIQRVTWAGEKCWPVYIRSQEIEPLVLNVAKGDCVVWINWTQREDVQIIFREGKKCADMTKSPMRFQPDFSGCYLTDYVGFGETSSLLFVEAGRFNYEVKYRRSGGGPQGPGSTAKSGSIIVK